MRLDKYLFENKITDSRSKASQAISRGEIFVNGKAILKNSFEVNLTDTVLYKPQLLFVSLGGYKLHKALNDFNFSANNLTCVDVGASTGGFTDVLLQNGAKKVYSVDLNDGLLHEKLKNDDRVFPVIKNAKNLLKEDFSEEIDLIVADLSFISETEVLPVLKSIVKKDGFILILIKPQFELGERKRFKNGIIKDKSIIENACKKIFSFGQSLGLSPINFTSAPISKDKNREFLILFKNGNSSVFDLNSYNF